MGLSEYNRDVNHVELKGPHKDDPVIRFDMLYDPDINDGTMKFQLVHSSTLFCLIFILFETGSWLKLMITHL